MHGCAECRKCFIKREMISIYTLWKLMYVSDTLCFLVTYERLMFIQMVKKVYLSCCGN